MQLKELREIENHYALTRIAANSEALRGEQRAWFAAQESWAREHASANAALWGIRDGLSAVAEAIDYHAMCIESALEEIQSTLAAQHDLLTTIAALLREPLATRARELITQADQAITAGILARDRVQEAEFADAQDLLTAVLANPVGRRHALAWFHLGWLHWKRRGAILEAEQAFFHASRLSLDQPAIAVVFARHHAYMLAELGKYTDAEASVAQLAVQTDNADGLFDAARYAARAGHTNAAIRYLRRALVLRPAYSLVALNEPDFGCDPRLLATVEVQLSALAASVVADTIRLGRSMLALEVTSNAMERDASALNAVIVGLERMPKHTRYVDLVGALRLAHGPLLARAQSGHALAHQMAGAATDQHDMARQEFELQQRECSAIKAAVKERVAQAVRSAPDLSDGARLLLPGLLAVPGFGVLFLHWSGWTFFAGGGVLCCALVVITLEPRFRAKKLQANGDWALAAAQERAASQASAVTRTAHIATHAHAHSDAWTAIVAKAQPSAHEQLLARESTLNSSLITADS